MRRKCMASAACCALAFLGLFAAAVVVSAHPNPNANVILQHQQRSYSAKKKMMHGRSGKPAMPLRSNGNEIEQGFERNNGEEDVSNRKLGSKPSSSSSSEESESTWSSSSSTSSSSSSSSSKSGKSTKTSKSKTGKSSSAKYRSEDVDIPIDTPAPTTPYPTLPPPTTSPSSKSPTLGPTSTPPTMHPTTLSPTDGPSTSPSDSPTSLPSGPPTAMGSSEPSSAVSEEPSVPPSGHPTDQPSNVPTEVPSYMPTTTGSIQSMMPSEVPSTSPTIGQSALPTVSTSSSLNPTRADRTRPPTVSPTSSVKPTIGDDDTYEPTYSPSKSPVKGDESGTISPKPSSSGDTNVPTYSPTASPIAGGTSAPTTQNVTSAPTPALDGPTSSPTIACNDTIGWIDAGRFGCSWYEENDEPGCPKYGNVYGGDMGVANDNCCYCGKETRPTSSPVEVGPTASPKPTWIVTNAPTVDRGSSPPTSGPAVGGTSPPTASPVVTASEFPSASPSIKILPPTASPTENTPIPTFLPTTSSPTDIITIDNRINLQMELYGMPSDLTPAERLWYQLRTARYMEDFYSSNPHAWGLFQDSIKEEVYDVDVKVIVTDQEVVVVDGGDDGGSGGRNDIDNVLGLGRDDVDPGKLSLSLELDPVFAYPTGYHSQPELEGSSSKVNPMEGSRVYQVGSDEDEDDESYLPEFAVEDDNRRRNRRQLLEQRKRQIMSGPQEREGRRSLQTLTYVTDPCTGENPLLLTFSLELSYRTEDPDIRGSDDVIAFPFEPPSFRTVYINNYLKSNNGVLQEDFQDLYCVTPIFFNGTAPAPSPPSGTLSPTVSLQPTVANATASPSDLPSESPSLSPSTSSSPTSLNMPSGSPTISAVPSSLPSMAPSTSPSSMPSGMPSSNPSMAPSTSPSSMPSSSPSSMPSGMPSSNPSSIPSALNGTLSPTTSSAPTSASLNGTLIPTVSSMPTNSNSPSVLNGTTVTPTLSSAPTTDVIVPEPLPGLGMRLFGMTEDLAEGSGLNYYQDATARYIRIFYNNYTVADDTIRGQVIDVTAEVAITNQEVTDGTETDGGGELSSYIPTLSPTPVLERISLTRWNGDDEGDEEFLPESGTNDNEAEDTSAVSKKKTRTKHTAHLSLTKLVPPRRLSESMDVDIMRELQLNETCAGQGLDLVFTVTIEYRLTGGASNSPYTDDDIINEPFSTSDYRDVYLNDFLQGSESAGNFDSVTCTSPINFPDGNGTGNATLAPTISPRPSGSPISPVPTSIGANGTLAPTISPMPSSIGVNGTSTPTISPMPSSIGVNGTSTPTISPMPSSIGVNGTSTPTISPMPSSIEVNGTSAPTLSPVPSSIEVNGTSAPTLSPRPSSTAPPGEGNSTNSTSAPTILSSVPSVTPGDDIFNEMRVIDPTAYERKCHDKLDALPYDQKTSGEEFEVSFEYGIESSSDDLEYIVEDMESLILDFMATSVLRCDSPTHQQQQQQQQQGVSSVVKLRRKNGDGEEDATTADLENAVVRIRYPEFGEITSISKCDTTPSQAKGCAILRTKLLITSIGAPTPQAHRDILNVLSGAFREDVFEEFIPDVVSAFYLGPDPEAIVLPSAATGAEDTIEGPEKNSTLVAILFTISCVVILFMIIACHVFPRVRMQAMEKVALFFGRRRHKPLPTSSGPQSSEDGLAGALVTYTDYSDEALNEGKLVVY